MLNFNRDQLMWKIYYQGLNTNFLPNYTWLIQMLLQTTVELLCSWLLFMSHCFPISFWLSLSFSSISLFKVDLVSNIFNLWEPTDFPQMCCSNAKKDTVRNVPNGLIFNTLRKWKKYYSYFAILKTKWILPYLFNHLLYNGIGYPVTFLNLKPN